VGGARMAASGAMGAVRAGTAMGSAASTAYALGKETAARPSVAAGLGGVAQAAGNAARSRVSGALGVGEAAQSDRKAAWNALNETPPATSSSGNSEGMPAWAQALRAEQTSRHRRQLAVHAVGQGDRGGGAATPDIKERD